MTTTRPRCDALWIDGNNLAHRAWHTHPSYFERAIRRAVETHRPKWAAVAFDDVACFRSTFYPEYKAGRSKHPAELRHWLNGLSAAGYVGGVPVVESLEYEADDVLATLAAESERRWLYSLLLTSDRDALACVSAMTAVVTIGAGAVFTYLDERAVETKMGVIPRDVAYYKALAGDPGDGVPGVLGLGPVTARKIVNSIETIRSIDDVVAELRKPEYLRRYGRTEEAIRLSYELVRLRDDATLSVSFDALGLGVPA